MATATATTPATTSTSTQPARKVAPPPFTVSNVRTHERFLRMLAYGKPGAGKTTLMATACDVATMNDIFMINAEAGDMSIFDNPLIQDDSGLDIAIPNNYRQFVKMYEYLSAHHKYRDILDADPDQKTDDGKNAYKRLVTYEAALKGLDPEDIDEPKLYRTIIIDSLTEIERMAMDNFLGAGATPGEIDISEDVKVAEFKEYKQVNNTVNRIMRAFKYMPYHLLVVCGADYTQNEMKQQVFTPSLTGKLSTQVQGYFDIVGFMTPGREGDKIIRRLWIAPEGKWDAKCRRAALKVPFLDNVNMSTIMARCGLTDQAKSKKGKS